MTKIEDESLKNAILKILKDSEIVLNEDKIEVAAVQMKNYFDNIGENPSFCEIYIVSSKKYKSDSIISLLKNKTKSKIQPICKRFEQNDIMCEGKEVPKNDANSEYLFLLVDMADELYAYAGIVRFILKNILKKVRNANELTKMTEEKDKFLDFLEGMHNTRLLLGGYAEFYLKSMNLPDAELLIELSAARYEGSESEARIYFDQKSTLNVCTLDESGEQARIIQPDKLRMVRKLMEISKRDKIFLYAEKQENDEFIIKQLVKKKAKKDKGLYIKFSGFMHWSILHNGREEITYYHGKYYLNYSDKNTMYHAEVERLERELPGKYLDQMEEWFGGNKLKDLIRILKKQKHGTSVIITDCKSNIETLCQKNRGMLLSDNGSFCKTTGGEWDEEQILSVTGIDGAIFMDLGGNCTAIGVLVDGEAMIQGDVGRGARYNSIVNYVKIKEKEEGLYIGIIVSEDGMINIVSNQTS